VHIMSVFMIVCSVLYLNFKGFGRKIVHLSPFKNASDVLDVD